MQMGPLEKIIIKKKDSGYRFAFIIFNDSESVIFACQCLDKIELYNMGIRVLPRAGSEQAEKYKIMREKGQTLLQRMRHQAYVPCPSQKSFIVTVEEGYGYKGQPPDEQPTCSRYQNHPPWTIQPPPYPVNIGYTPDRQPACFRYRFPQMNYSAAPSNDYSPLVIKNYGPAHTKNYSSAPNKTAKWNWNRAESSRSNHGYQHSYGEDWSRDRRDCRNREQVNNDKQHRDRSRSPRRDYIPDTKGINRPVRGGRDWNHQSNVRDGKNYWNSWTSNSKNSYKTAENGEGTYNR